MTHASHIPHYRAIADFFAALRIGTPSGHLLSVTRIHDQPAAKRLAMPLFRCGFFRLVVLLDAGVAFEFPGRPKFDATAGALYASAPGKLEGWRSAADMRGYLLCVSPDYGGRLLLGGHLAERFGMFGGTFPNGTAAPTATLQRIVQLFEWAIDAPARANTELADDLLGAVLAEAQGVFDATMPPADAPSRSADAHFSAFRQNLDRAFADLAAGLRTTHPTVAEFAAQADLTASHFNAAVKRASGRSTTEHIAARTVLEAKSYLLHTDLPVSEVAYRLGFREPAYFSRYFRRHAGASPTGFAEAKQDT